jgi:hypothetical protein
MAKAGTRSKPKPDLKKDREQFERFRETARKLGVDDEKSTETFESAFRKIVPPKRPNPSS